MEKQGGEFSLERHLETILKRASTPAIDRLHRIVNLGQQCLLSEEERSRPRDRRGLPGGLVYLSDAEYYVIVPDLHARMDFFRAVMGWSYRGGRTVLEDLAFGRAQVVCVGDAFHSEARGRERWNKALGEYRGGWKRHRNMDEEMRENLGLLEMICLVKSWFPRNFHFLKGNHENIDNEMGHGNYPFRKFVEEGDMVKSWMLRFYGEETVRRVYYWEKSLPHMAAGENFLVTHCEPSRDFYRDEVINANIFPDVIYGLTWVDNDQAQPGSAAGTLREFFGKAADARIFGGHRPVIGRFALRQEGAFVQINTPNDWVVAAFTGMEGFDPETNIIKIG